MKNIENEIMEMYNNGMTEEAIGITLNRDQTTISKIINKLIEDGKLKNREEELEQKIIQLYKQGKSPKEIADEVDRSYKTIYRRIKKLIDANIIKKQEKKVESVLDISKKIENKIIKYYNQGISYKEIAQKIEVGENSTGKIIKGLIEEGKIGDRKISRKPKENKITPEEEKIILELYKKGLTPSEIAKKTNKVVYTVNNRLVKLSNEGKIDNIKIKRILEDLDFTEKNIKIIHEYMKGERGKYTKGEFKSEKFNLIEKSVEFLDDQANIEEVTFLINLYIKNKDYEKCLRFINNILSIKKWDTENKNKLLKYEEEVKISIKKVKAFEMLKNGKEVNEISEKLGLQETIVVKVRNEYIKSEEKEK